MIDETLKSGSDLRQCIDGFREDQYLLSWPELFSNLLDISTDCFKHDINP
jgi:hypothetical protein